jgi:hypothetical protein
MMQASLFMLSSSGRRRFVGLAFDKATTTTTTTTTTMMTRTARTTSTSTSTSAGRRRRIQLLLLRPKPTRMLPIKNRSQSTTTSAAATAATAAATAATETAAPITSIQLRRVFLQAAVPMIGFGFTDQTVMLQAGNAIDCTLGVTFGLSTLTAAAIGQICSDASGVIFGGTLERLATSMGLPSPQLTLTQRLLPIVSHTKWLGSLLGVMFGCTLGLVNLLWIDTGRSSTLKLQAFNDEQEFEFEIEASNAIRPGIATTLTVTGPDVEGLLASMTATMAVRGCSIVEVHAKRQAQPQQSRRRSSLLSLDDAAAAAAAQEEESLITTTTTLPPPQTISNSNNNNNNNNNNYTTSTMIIKIEDVFHVVKRDTGLPFDDDELEELAQGLLDSTRTPMNVNSVKAAMHELESTNDYLKARVKKLEQYMYDKQITIVTSGGIQSHPNHSSSSSSYNNDENENDSSSSPEELKKE